MLFFFREGLEHTNGTKIKEYLIEIEQGIYFAINVSV